MECMQLDLLMDLSHLLQTSQNETSQWEHFFRASTDTNGTDLGPRHTYTKICFNSKDPISGLDTLIGGYYYRTEYPSESDPEKSWLPITSIDGKQFFAAAQHSGMAQRGGNRIMTLNARTKLKFEKYTRQFPYSFTSQFRQVR